MFSIIRSGKSSRRRARLGTILQAKHVAKREKSFLDIRTYLRIVGFADIRNNYGNGGSDGEFLRDADSLAYSVFGSFGRRSSRVFSNVASGAVTIGAGLALLGVSIIIMPLFFMLVKLMWKLFVCFFAWLKGLFDGKEKRI